MVTTNKIAKIIDGYDKQNIRIASLGGHSALDVCRGAKSEGFETIVVAERGREKTYEKYYRTRGAKGCIDHVILVDKFADIVKPEIQEKLRSLNAIFVHSRYFWVYCDYNKIESDFLVPIFGNRVLVRKEERTEEWPYSSDNQRIIN
jgi:5-formaminoimidazole-4-carboxamide-1-(beta)-D-ribofuranosyl 5'-monophosphate synthetase